jgi:hypothetical protein
MLQVDLVDGIDLVTASRHAGFHQKLGIWMLEKRLSEFGLSPNPLHLPTCGETHA